MYMRYSFVDYDLKRSLMGARIWYLSSLKKKVEEVNKIHWMEMNLTYNIISRFIFWMSPKEVHLKLWHLEWNFAGQMFGLYWSRLPSPTLLISLPGLEAASQGQSQRLFMRWTDLICVVHEAHKYANIVWRCIRKSQIFLRPLFGLINVWRLTLVLKCLLPSDICPFCLTFIYSKISAIL